MHSLRHQSRRQSVFLAILILLCFCAFVASCDSEDTADDYEDIVELTFTDADDDDTLEEALEWIVGAAAEHDSSAAHDFREALNDAEDSSSRPDPLTKANQLVDTWRLLQSKLMWSWPVLLDALIRANCVASDIRHIPQNPLCRRPIAIIVAGGSNFSYDGQFCQSCQQLAADLSEHYRAEFTLLANYVTLVDAGNFHLADLLQQHPFPLALPPPHHTPFPIVGRSQLDATESQMNAQVLYRARSTSRASRRASTKWTSLTRRAFAGQQEYATRILFLYPHNGSIMHSIVNEDAQRADEHHLHFYFTALPLLRSMVKAAEVFHAALLS